MMSLFSRGASPPNKNTSATANASAPSQPNLSQTNPATSSLPSQPQAAPTHPITIMDNKSTAQGVTEPPSHVIHSPLPSRPSPVQPASTIDELLQGFRSNSPGNETAPSQTPPPLPQQQIPATLQAPLSQHQMQSQSLQNQLLGTIQQQQQQPSQQQQPALSGQQQLANQLLQSQPQQSQSLGAQQNSASIDLLSMLSNGGNSGSPALSSGSGQPAQASNKAKEAQEANAGRMLLDSLLSSTAPQPQPLPSQPNQSTFQAPPPPPTLPQPVISEPQQQSQQQAPRKGPFDFISPMDAFAPPPVPPHPTKQVSLSHHSQSQASEGKPSPATFDKGIPLATSPPQSIQSVNIHGDSMASGSQQGDHEDPTRRKSIDLLEQLTRAAPSHGPISSNDHLPSFGNQSYQPPSLPSQQVLGHQQQPSYSQPQGQSYGQVQGFQSQQSVLPPQLAAFRNAPQRVPSPLRQEQTQAFKSDRDQSPALLGQTPPSTSPAAGQAASPGYNNNKGRGQGPKGGKPKTDFKTDFGKGNEFKTRSPANQVTKAEQNFTLDLSLPLAATSASNESLHITPIALLKLESIYVPGCTIGVSHWIAYAMTKGRVRLIARANGARALLKLPQTFSANSSIVDLVTSGNRLAGVTSDGGFVVWEVPPMVDDDIPSLLLVSVPPNPQNPYKSIKWHPNDPDMLALSTTTEIHLINVSRLYRIHAGESIGQNTLVQDAEIFPAVAPSQQFAANPLAALSQGSSSGPILPGQLIAAFAFDPSHNALATISQEGQLNLWAAGSQQPPSYQAEPSYGHQSYMQQHQLLWSGKVAGEGAPSSLFFMDQAQGVIIGRKRNTIIQLVSPKSTNVQASVKYTYGNGVFGGAATSTVSDNNDFFAHLAYDPRIRCVWAASSHRSSIMALRVAAQEVGKGEQTLAFEQILDFPILHPTISLGILVGSDANDMEEMERGSSGMETGSAVGAMGGELSMALVAYVIHAGGVDQVLIGKQDLEVASQAALSKLPVQANQPQQQQPRQESPSNLLGRHPPSGPRELLKAAPTPPNVGPHPVIGYNEQAPPSFGTAAPTASLGARNVGPMDTNSPQRPRSPASGAEEEAENTVDASGHPGTNKRGGRRGRDKKGGQHHVIPGNMSDSAASSFAGEASASILREIQKVEDGLTNKISAVVGREFRDQQRKLEQMHEAEKFNAAEFQDRLVKNLSGELVKNTGRVFEAALKTEVQRTILPALEIITKTEVRQVLDTQIVRGIGESMNQTLPNEIERLLLRPDVSNHVARTFSQTVTPIIERHVKDSINRTLIPAYQESTSEMYDGLYREISEEILNLKKEIVTWQSEALKGQESLLRDMELSIRSLTEQVKNLSANRSNTPYHVQSHRSSPAPIPVHLRGQQSQAYPTMDKMANISSWQQISAVAKPEIPVAPAHQQQMNVPMQMPIATQPQYAPPQQLPPQFQQQQVPPVQSAPFQVDRPEEWEKTFLAALSSPDNRTLRDVLATCPADKVMPLNGPLLVGQTIVLSVIHKLAGTIAEVETLDESISLLWWLTRASQVLDAHDRIIHDYLDKMLPNIQENLFRAIPRFAGAGPQYNRQMSDLLQTLVIKAHNPQ